MFPEQLNVGLDLKDGRARYSDLEALATKVGLPVSAFTRSEVVKWM
jgi:hypothetical protein